MDTAQIVLIEDNPADVMLVELALQENGIDYELTRFENGEDAVEALCAPAAVNPPAAILLDLNTPGSDGIEVLGRLTGSPHLKGVLIAILSSSQARSDKQRTILMGAVRYIEKPSQLKEFLETVGRAVKEMLTH